MNYESARFNMIEQQIRPWNVLTLSVLDALGRIRREDFVPKRYRHLAFADMQIPIGRGQVMLEPKVSARLVESLGSTDGCRILEIGTGTGYVTALLATVGGQVTSIEIDPEQAEAARKNLSEANIGNAEVIHADCFEFCGSGREHSGKYDRVLVTGSLSRLAPVFLPMTTPSGCVVGIQGHDPVMRAVACYPQDHEKSLFETHAPRLINAVETQAFEF